ncbi:MAG: hypothetical protein PV344_06730 [Anaplasma sp.]|nr:hypothetical protein [Anaplasma sp.]
MKRDITRGMKVIKRLYVMRIEGRCMSQIISLYKVIHSPCRKIRRILGGIRAHDPSVASRTRY